MKLYILSFLLIQSTLNSENGLGTTAQSTIFLAQIISSMFVPTLMVSIKKLIID